MKRKQLCSLITVALMASSLVMQCNVPQVQAKEEKTVTAAASKSIDLSKLACTFNTNQGQDQTSSIAGSIELQNNSGEDIDLTQIKLDYLYTNEENLNQEFHCYYSGTLNNVNGYQNFTDKVTGEFLKNEDTSKADATDICQVGFNGGILPAGEKITIQIAFNHVGWSAYTQSNDYSFKNGFQIHGVKDDMPVIKQGELSYQRLSDAVVKTDIDYSKDDSVKLTGIKGLTEGKDYEVDAAGNVTFKNSYLDSLKPGEYTLVYEFSNNKTATVKLTVKKEPAECKISIGSGLTVKGGEEVLVPVKLSDFKGKFGIEDFEFTVEYDASKLELEGVQGAGELAEFSDLFTIKDSKAGSARIQYLADEDDKLVNKDGDICFLKFKAKDVDTCKTDIKIKEGSVTCAYFNSDKNKDAVYGADIENGSVKIIAKERPLVDIADGLNVKAGETVEVPVSLKNFQGKYGIEDFEFTVNYDATRLELVGVEGAGALKEFNDLFAIKDAKEGSARIQYLADEDDKLVSADGDICVLKFKAKEDAEDGKADIKIKAGSTTCAYFDLDTNKDATYRVETEDGFVNVAAKPQPTVDIADGLKVKAGETVEVPVSLKNFEGKYGIEDFEFTVNYDATRLELVGVEGAGALKEFSDLFEIKDAKEGSARIQYLADEDDKLVSADGDICVLKFKAKEDAEDGKADIKIKEGSTTCAYFDLDTNKDATYKVKAENGFVNVVSKPKPTVDIADGVAAKAGTTVEVPVSLKNFEGKYGIEDFEFTVNYDSKKLKLVGVEGAGALKEFSDLFEIKDAKDGSARIQYLADEDDKLVSADGDICVLKFEVKDDAEGKAEVNIKEGSTTCAYFDLDTNKDATYKVIAENGFVNVLAPNRPTVDIADGVEAKKGEEVLVPVNLKDFAGKYGIEDFEFTVNYDADKLELVGVEGAGSLAEFSDLFEIKDAEEGSARVQYLADEDDKLVSADGDICTLKFKVKDNAQAGKAEVNIKEESTTCAYFDLDSNKDAVYKVNTENGFVMIKDGDPTPKPVKDAEVKLETSVFDKYKPADVTADVVFNGHKLTEVKGLNTGDYKVSGDKVVISKDALAKLSVGTHELTFVFDAGAPVKVVLEVKDTTPVVAEKDFKLATDEIKASAGETVLVPIKVKVKGDSDATGVMLRVYDTAEYSYVGNVKGKEMAAISGMYISTNYNKTTKSAKSYCVFNKGSVDGEYVLVTLKLKLNANLASGSKVKLDVRDVTFGDKSGKKLDFSTDVKDIVIK